MQKNRLEKQSFPETINVLNNNKYIKITYIFKQYKEMSYKVLYNPALLINEMILFGDTLINMSVNVKLFSNKINLKKSYSIQSTNI